MSKHTPGPWRIEFDSSDDNGSTWFDIIGGEGLDEDHIASMVYQEANAHLIAAAPYMYEALCLLVDRGLTDDAHLLETAFAIIAKAEGRS